MYIHLHTCIYILYIYIYIYIYIHTHTHIYRLSDSDQYMSLKEELRKRKKRLQAIPRLTLKAVGENAILDVRNIGKRIPIFLSDIQHLLLYSLLGHHSPYLPARWCQLDKYNKVILINVISIST